MLCVSPSNLSSQPFFSNEPSDLSSTSSITSDPLMSGFCYPITTTTTATSSKISLGMQDLEETSTLGDSNLSFTDDMYSSVESFLDEEGLDIISLEEIYSTPKSIRGFVQLKRLPTIHSDDGSDLEDDKKDLYVSKTLSCVSRRLALRKIRSSGGSVYDNIVDEHSQSEKKAERFKAKVKLSASELASMSIKF